MAIVLCVALNERIPVRVSNSNYILSIYEKFLKTELEWTNEDFLIWKGELIKFAYDEECVEQLDRIPSEVFERKREKDGWKLKD